MPRVLALLLLLTLAACQAEKRFDAGDTRQLHQQPSSTPLLHTLKMIKRALENGHIMQARRSVLAMKRSHPDYAKAQQLLKQQIEPARQRIFNHYLNTATRLEKNRLWSEAMWAYDQASAVSLQPAQMIAKRDAMAQKLRQARFDHLIQQRRAEDEVLLKGGRLYQAPRGLPTSDKVLAYLRERYNDQIDARADDALHDAETFLREGYPEIAYIELESLLRLQPENRPGQRLMAKVRKALPKGFDLRIEAGAASRQGSSPQRQGRDQRSHQQVTRQDVLAAMARGDLLHAKSLVYRYRRQNGKGAQQLLNRVWRAVNAQAAADFATGSRAFREEQLDRAIEYWSKAVRLKPNEAEYVDSLKRARQLKERLQLLREQAAE